MEILAVSAVSLAFFHSLAPDHWLPFTALARGNRWSMRRLAAITTLAGLGHVISSLIIGMLGLWAGWALHRAEGIDAWRSGAVIWMLVGFGVAYALWGLKHAQHPHPHISVQDVVKTFAARRVRFLIAILIFGPCEPLIPLMFLAYKQGMQAVWVIAVVFSAVTVAMIVGQSCLAYAGVRLIQAHWMERYAHAMTGLVIALTALAVLWLGL